jgi:hypothetical protein
MIIILNDECDFQQCPVFDRKFKEIIDKDQMIIGGVATAKPNTVNL